MLLHHVSDQNQSLLSLHQSSDEQGWENGEEGGMSIGEDDEEEEKELNEDYDADDLEEQKDEIIDTNPEGSPHPVPQHGLVEEGPGPDA